MAELKIGSTLQKGKYEITKVLGSGNFGITYLASTKIAVKGQMGQMDVTINVAIKEFYMKDLNNRTSDGSTVEGTQNTMVKNYRNRFKKEAENLAKLHHPNIVKVIEVFDENNTSYYVMEYIEGGSLDDYIKSNGRLPEVEALKCTMEIADALSYMHKNMMIHLDLKPKNIMRNSKGHLFLIDFGLSKQYDENGEPESSTSIGLGTPGYAPLEQASYKQDGTLPVTLDIYALGASLFKMLTGKTPPESSAILNEGFPLSSLQKVGISANTILIVEKAMASVKKDRYQSVSSVSKAIGNLTGNLEQTKFDEDESSTSYDEGIEVNKVDTEEKSSHHIKVSSEIDKSKSERKRGLFKIVGAGIVLFFLIAGILLYINSEKDSTSDLSSKIESVNTKEIDLGLPSGTIWAGWNVGANAANDYGTLYTWGALSPHNKESNDEYYNSISTLYVDSVCYSRGGMISGSEYDVAHKIWGNDWCIPTKEQVNELINQCEWKWGSYKGCNGMIGKGPNGNLIFFPATGYSNENGIWYKNNEGDYWCGDLCNPSKHDHSNYDPAVIEDAENYRRSNCYSFSKTDDISSGCSKRYFGYAVRPIKNKL